MMESIAKALEARTQRIRALEAILHALVDKPILDRIEDNWHYCRWCGMSATYQGFDQAFPHKPDCPWEKAQVLLGEKGKG